MRQTIVLGTAQWGEGYGVTNPKARLSDPEVFRIVDTARARDIRKLDTASSYQDAESRVARFAPGFEVQTKIAVRNLTPSEIQRELYETVERLAEGQQLSVLIHDWSVLDEVERRRALEVLLSSRDSGDVAGVGISAYEESELVSALESVCLIDIVQVPTSILDQRLVQSSVLCGLRELGARIQARSIFLQGLLLSKPVDKELRPELVSFWERASEFREGRLGLCVGFIKAQDWIDEVVIGVTSNLELAEIHEAFMWANEIHDWDSWASKDLRLIDPRTW